MRLLIPILVFILTPGLALARPPQSNFGNAGAISRSLDHHQIQAAQGITIPYEFAPLDLDSPDAEPLPSVDFTDTAWINYVGSIAVSLVALFDSWKFMAIFAVLMISVVLLFRFLWPLVTDTPGRVSLKFTDAANLGADMIDQRADYDEARAADYETRSRLSGGSHLGGEADRLRGRAAGNRRLSGGLRGGARSIKRAKGDFRNPFK